MSNATATTAYDGYTDADLDAAAAGFVSAYERSVRLTAKLGFGDAGAYYLNALHGVALEMDARRTAAADEAAEAVEVEVVPVRAIAARRPVFALGGALLLDDTLAFYGEGPQEVMAWVNVPR